MSTDNKRLIWILVTVTVILLIPLIGMQFNNGIDWSMSDFIMMAVLLFGSGLACELVLRNVKKIQRRIVACAVILGILLIVWAELAVGIFGTPFAGS